MELSELPQFQATVQNPLAALTWLVLSVLTWYAVAKTGKAGYRGSKWAARKVRTRYATPELAAQAKALVGLADLTLPWTNGDLPAKTSCRLPSGVAVVLDRVNLPSGRVRVTLDGVDALYGIAAAEQVQVEAAFVDLLDGLMARKLMGKLTPTAPSTGFTFDSGNLISRAELKDACFVGTGTYTTSGTEPSKSEGSKSNADALKVMLPTFRVTVRGEPARLWDGRVLYGSSKGGYGVYVRLNSATGPRVLVRIASQMTHTEACQVVVCDDAGKPLPFGLVDEVSAFPPALIL